MKKVLFFSLVFSVFLADAMDAIEDMGANGTNREFTTANFTDLINTVKEMTNKPALVTNVTSSEIVAQPPAAIGKQSEIVEFSTPPTNQSNNIAPVSVSWLSKGQVGKYVKYGVTTAAIVIVIGGVTYIVHKYGIVQKIGDQVKAHPHASIVGVAALTTLCLVFGVLKYRSVNSQSLIIE